MHRIHTIAVSVFDAMVDELDLDEQDAHQPLRPNAVTAIDAIWQAAHAPAPPIDPLSQTSHYSDFATDGTRIFDDLVTDEDSIRSELGLLPGLSTDQVSALRRRFARRNHPDLFPPALRSLATLRMTIANSLCDAYAG